MFSITFGPENRLVARGLEKEWETRLQKLATAEAELHRREQQRPRTLTEEERRKINTLGSDLRLVWSAPTTTDAAYRGGSQQSCFCPLKWRKVSSGLALVSCNRHIADRRAGNLPLPNS